MRTNQQNNFSYDNNKDNHANTHLQSNMFSKTNEHAPQWKFQKVQSVIQVQQQHQSANNYHYYQENLQPILHKTSIQNKNLFSNNLSKDNTQTTSLFPYNQSTKYHTTQQNHQQSYQERASHKTNSDTNYLVSQQSQSLEYLSSQQPSFSNKGEFTVLEDFISMETNRMTNQHQHINHQPMDRKKIDWKIASFAPKSIKTLTIKEKCQKIFQFLQQLKFMKQGFESKLKQQQNYFTTQLQELKKLLFKLNINYEKQMIQWTKNTQQKLQSKLYSSRVASTIQTESKENQFNQLRMYCQKLQNQKLKAQEKYSYTLKKYQQQIDIISQELSNKINNQNLPSFQSLQPNCQNCMKLQQILENYTTIDQQVQVWKNRFKEQREQHNQNIKKMEKQMFKLQQQLNFMQQSKIESQQALKQKQKQIFYQQSQIQYRIKDIEKRQNDLQMAQMILKKQKDEIQNKKQKIADYQYRVLREQRKQKNEFGNSKQKEILSSEYFSNSNKIPTVRGENYNRLRGANNHYERSDSLSSSKGSRIDINARLREIQMMKGKANQNYDDSITSRNSSKDSHYSALKQFTSSKVSTSTKNFKDYGIKLPPSSQKQHKRQSGQSIKLSQKLNRLTQTLQNQLRQMN